MTHSDHYRFTNRAEAGRLLASALASYANQAEVIVLALPRGGVPVGFEIARVLNAPLGVCLVRKLGVPGHRELAMGAIASGGIRVLNEDVVERLHISSAAIQAVTLEEQKELERRENLYSGCCDYAVSDDLELHSSLDLQDRIIILVDDGIATGSTLKAAISCLRQRNPKKLVVAVPVAPPMVSHRLKQEVDELVCLLTPTDLYAIGTWYDNFEQVTDNEVRELLQTSA
ncbi:MAG: phosphoribosyltransferase [Leptolyngbyaceae bacterium]|nr:phosphoribosyltransferase [Leptolyngbyaceae bacterium]